MSDNIDIKIKEDGSRVVSRSLDEVAQKADGAQSAIDRLNKSISANARLAQASNNSATAKLYKEREASANLAAAAEHKLAEAMLATQAAARATASSLTNKLLKERAADAELAAAATAKLNTAMMNAQTAAYNNSLSITNKLLKERAAAAELATLAEDKLKRAAASNIAAAQANSASITQRLQAQKQTKTTSAYDSLMNSSSVTTQPVVDDEPVKRVASAHKNLSNAVKESSSHQSIWNSIAKDGHAAARGLSGSLGALWMTYGSVAPLLAGAAIGAVFKEAAAGGSEFAYQLTFVKALGGESAEAVKALADQAKSLSKDSAFGPKEIASGYRVLAQAGVEAKDALKVMPDVLNLATAGELSMENATLAVVGSINAFKLSMSDSGKVSDLFAKAAAVSQSSVTDLTQAMKTASTAGTQYGQSIEDTMTALALMAKVNIVGTSAGTAYRNMLKEIYTPTKQAAGAWKELNIETTKMVNGQRQTRDFVEIMYDLKKATEKFDNPSKGKIIGYLFGERGAKEAAEMLDMTYDQWKEFQNKIVNSKGFGASVAEELNATAKNEWKEALNTLEVELINAFERMEPQFVSLAQQFKTIFQSEDFRSTVDVILSTTVTLANAFVDLAPIIVEVAKAWLVLKAAQAGAGIAALMATAASAAQGLAGAMLAASGAMGPVARGATMLGPLIAALGGPITIVAGLLAAGATAWLIWGNSSKEACDKAANAANAASASIASMMEQQKAGMAINSASWTLAANQAMKAKAEVEKQINKQLADSNEVTNMGLRFGNGMVFDASNKEITNTIKEGKGWTKDVANLLGQYNTLTSDIRVANENMREAVNAEGKAKKALEEASKPKNVVTPKTTGTTVWTPPSTEKQDAGASGRLSKEEEALSKLKARLEASKQEYDMIQKYGQAQFQLNEGQTKSLEIQKKIVELENSSTAGLKEKGLAQRKEQLDMLKQELVVSTQLGEQIQKNELLKVDSKLAEEVRMTTLLPEQRAIENKYLTFRNELLGKGVILDEQQSASLKQRIADQIELNKVMSARDALVQGSGAQQTKDFATSADGLKQATQTPGWTQGDTDKNTMQQLSNMGVDTSKFQETQNAMLAQQEVYYQQLQALRDKDLISEETYQNAKAQLEIKSQEIRLSGMTTFFTSLATLQNSGNSTLARIGKAAAISQATMDGVVAVQKAYAGSPYPWNIAAAAAQAAISAANVAKISGLNFATGGSFVVGGSGGVDSQQVSMRASPGERITVATPTQVRKGDEYNRGKGNDSGGRGGNIIHVHLPSGSTEETRRSAGQGAREGLAVMNQASRYK